VTSRDPYRSNRKRRVALRATEARASRRVRVPPLDLSDPTDLTEEQSA
jgi:hypothetical protein